MSAMTQTMRARIVERGNGFCDVGDYVAGDDGMLYRVVRIVGSCGGTIHTGDRPGAPNYMYAEVEPADWDDITDAEADDIICSCSVEDDDDDDDA